MKINVTIDLEEIWADENTIGEEISREIKRHVISEIWNKVKPAVDDQITRTVKNEVEKNYCKKINLFIEDFINNGEINFNSQKGTVKEYIHYLLTQNTGWNSPKDQIEKLAKNYGIEMKNRYDLLFASQLVAKMNENGLLKEDVAKTLLSK